MLKEEEFYTKRAAKQEPVSGEGTVHEVLLFSFCFSETSELKNGGIKVKLEDLGKESNN